MPKLLSLKLADVSDREVLLALMDVADADGYAEAADIATRFDLGGENPKRLVASRLAWLRRFGAVDREFLWDENSNPILNRAGEQRHGQRWRLTDIGQQMATGSLKASQERLLDGLTDAQVLAVAGHVADQARYMGNFTAGKLIEREWKHRWARLNGWTRP